jgi:glycogen operon protein
VNYWGYQPVSFFAPHHAYGATRDPLTVIDAFRDMVKALHRASIEVILDVVYTTPRYGAPNGARTTGQRVDHRRDTLAG